ncbi:MAG TPA: isoprenylcysteine carboxylmethyltransferase family protein [Alphaproteobacteria bacterium]|jgi:protein-S-isoprenylcysteine O-methyltransferase Ste14|nr:isoprenylcysteine carboxylmethyltransferase family protein [Alphaproteobacteria bacterium]
MTSHSIATEDHPDAVVRPPRLYLAALAIAFALDWGWPVAFLPAGVAWPLGAALIVLGVAIMTVAVRQFHSAGTNVPTVEPTTAIVSDGLYGFSRNPIYLALSAIYLGIAVAADNLWAVALLLLVLVVMQRGVIFREEAYLEAKFGDHYRSYKAGVRRWI